MAGNTAPASLPFSGEAPFVTGGKFFPICRAKPGAKVYGVVVNPTVFGARCHYVDGRTFRCRVEEVPCPGCQEGNRVRWQGYLPFLDPITGRIGLAEITAQAAKDCPTLQVVGKSLRGLWIILERLGQSKRARVRVTFEEKTMNGRLPPPIDTAAALSSVWGQPVHLAGLEVNGDSREGGPMP